MRWLAVLSLIFQGSMGLASMSEIPSKGINKIMISITEAVMILQASPNSQAVKIQLLDGAQEDFQVFQNEGVIEIKNRDSISKQDFGKHLFIFHG